MDGFSFLVSNSGGWWPRVPLRRTASIIKEWHLLRRTGAMGAEERGGGT